VGVAVTLSKVATARKGWGYIELQGNGGMGTQMLTQVNGMLGHFLRS